MAVPLKYVLEGIDAATLSVVKEYHFDISDIEDLWNLLQVPASLRRPSLAYDVDAAQFSRLKQHYAINETFEGLYLRLAQRSAVHDLPYQVHTNRELALMLSGIKPLAIFANDQSPIMDEYQAALDEKFAPYVGSGLFIKRDYLELCPQGEKLVCVLYARRDEEWRIDAMISLRNTAVKHGWSAALVHLEGSLLGYEEWQADAYEAFEKKGRVAKSG